MYSIDTRLNTAEYQRNNCYWFAIGLLLVCFRLALGLRFWRDLLSQPHFTGFAYGTL
jgi:hypothetical protein